MCSEFMARVRCAFRAAAGSFYELSGVFSERGVYLLTGGAGSGICLLYDGEDEWQVLKDFSQARVKVADVGSGSCCQEGHHAGTTKEDNNHHAKHQ